MRFLASPSPSQTLVPWQTSAQEELEPHREEIKPLNPQEEAGGQVSRLGL